MLLYMSMRLLNQGKVLCTEKVLRGIFLHKRERERQRENNARYRKLHNTKINYIRIRYWVIK